MKPVAERYLQTLEKNNLAQENGSTSPKPRSPAKSPSRPPADQIRISPIRTTPRKSVAPMRVITPVRATGSPNRTTAGSDLRANASPARYGSPKASPTRSPVRGTIKGIEQVYDAEELPGLHRKKLQHDEDKSEVAVWDRERKNLQAYEYLCHVEEAKEWMEGVLGETLPDAIDLPEKLVDGVILAKITRHFRPDLVKRIFEHKRLQYRHIDNIDCFFKFIADVRVPDLFTFELIDLYERRNIPKVIYCIHALSHILANDDLAPQIGNLLGKVDFTDDQLSSTQRGLDASGLSMPNFATFRDDKERKVSLKLEPPRVKTPPPPVETSVDELALDVAAVHLTAEEILLMELEALEPEITAVQAQCRRKLYENRSMALQNKMDHHVHTYVYLQAACRGYLARTASPATQFVAQRKSRSLECLQAVVRGQQLRKSILSIDEYMASNKALISNLQAAARAFVARRKFSTSRAALHNDGDGFTSLQSVIRANQLRKKIADQKAELGKNQKAITAVQSHFRGVLSRFRMGCLFDDLDQEIVGIVGMQACVRGHLARNSLVVRTSNWDAHTDKIKTIQNLWRARRLAKAYQSLIADPNPGFNTIKQFVHLLNDSDADYHEEMELERSRKEVADSVQANEKLERYIDKLDTKIALLLRNKISLEEAVSQMPTKPPSELDSVLRSSHGSSGGKLSDDVFDLKALNKTSRQRLELYQGMFYVLQTKHEYLARLMSTKQMANVPERETKQIADWILQLFANASKPREEFFLLQMLSCSLRLEMDSTGSLHEFIRGPSMAWRLFETLNRRKASYAAARTVLTGAVTTTLSVTDLNVESDPLVIYRSFVAAEEEQGIYNRDPNATIDVAIQDPQTRSQFVKNLQQLRELSYTFIEALDANVDALPYYVRYLAREVALHGARKVAAGGMNLNQTAWLTLVGKIVFNHFLIPSMLAADSTGIVDQALDMRQATSLGAIAKILVQCASFQPFRSDEQYLQPLNEFVSQSGERLQQIFKRVIDIKDIQTEFCMTNLDDVTSHLRPQLTMKTSDVLALHSLIFQKLDAITDSNDSVLRPVVKQLGPLPSDARDILDIARFTTVKLDLNPSYGSSAVTNGASAGQFTTAKRCLISVLMVQPGNDLMSILVAPVTEQDEDNYGEFRSQVHDSELGELTFRELKLLTLEKILDLESSGRISRENGYQELLNSLADDIRNKHERRNSRSRELALCSATLVSLNDKNKYLKKRLGAYEGYIEDTMQTLQENNQNKKKKKKTPLLLKFLQELGISRSKVTNARFGAYKYSADKIRDRGILVHLKGYSERQMRDVNFTFKSEEASKFIVQVAYKGIQLPGGQATLTLDDLLNRQYSSQAYVDLFDDVVRLHTDRLLQFIFHKFYGAE